MDISKWTSRKKRVTLEGWKQFLINFKEWGHHVFGDTESLAVCEEGILKPNGNIGFPAMFSIFQSYTSGNSLMTSGYIIMAMSDKLESADVKYVMQEAKDLGIKIIKVKDLKSYAEAMITEIESGKSSTKVRTKHIHDPRLVDAVNEMMGWK